MRCPQKDEALVFIDENKEFVPSPRMKKAHNYESREKIPKRSFGEFERRLLSWSRLPIQEAVDKPRPKILRTTYAGFRRVVG